MICLLLGTVSLFAQTKISGTVKDSKGEPVIGAVVMLQGNSSVAGITDANGKYSVAIPDASSAKLEISCISYKTQVVDVAKRTVIDITLEDDFEQLDEVVVVGYGAMRRSDLTGSVTSVKIDEEIAARSSSLDQLIQGKAAGVQINTGSSIDSGVNIKIRGTGTLTGTTEPLYVVDGVILTSVSTSMLSESGTDSVGNDEQVNTLMGINPQDIASIEILKDASATAIYGSEGANGVVLITTKSANRDKPTVNFSAGLDYSTIAKKLDVLSFDEYVKYLDTAWDNRTEYGYTISTLESQRNRIYSDPDLHTGLRVTPVDWQDYSYRNTLRQRYFVSISGRPKTLSYLFSVGYNKADGIVQNTSNSQLTIRLNVDKSIGKKLKIGAKLNFAYIDSQLMQGASSYKQTASTSLVRSILVSRPYISNSIDLDNPEDDDDDEGTTALRSTPLRWITNSQNTRTEYRITPNIFLQWQITPWLTYKLSAGGDYHISERMKYKGRQLSTTGSLGANAQESTGEAIRWNLDNLLMFNKKFGGHNISGTLGMTVDTRNNHTQDLFGYNMPQEVFKADGINASPNTRFAYSESQIRMMSYFLRAIYNYKDRYVLTGTFRVDGSCKFRGKNVYSTFPSFAFAWRMNQEPWFNVGWISSAKLRAGWGKVGNSAVSSYQTMVTYTNIRIGSADDLSKSAGYYVGVTPDQMANSDLKWETTEQVNLGLDFGLFNGRFTLSADVYNKNTYDLLNQRNIPYSSGFAKRWVNQGAINNRGVELSMEAIPVKTSNFEWGINGNISWNRNRITDIGTDSEGKGIYMTPAPDGYRECRYYEGSVIGSGNYGVEPVNIFIEGQPMGLFYGYATNGIIQEGEEGPKFNIGNATDTNNGPGGIRYVDPNGDGFIDSTERTIIGDPNPDFTYGFGTHFSYKGLSLNVNFSGSYGNDICNHNNTMGWETTSSSMPNIRRTAFFDSWSKENPGGTMPRLNPGTSFINYFSDRYIEDGSYLRLSNISLSYSIPIKNFVLKNITVGASVNNVYVWSKYSGYDPEINSYGYDLTRIGVDNGSFPRTRTFCFDLKFTF